MTEIYRFRNTDSLLWRFKELERQEIYFAAPNELNDPMEGYRDVFWKGDAIVWKNLFINYIRSFEHVFRIFSVIGETKELGRSDIPDMYRLLSRQPSHLENIITQIVHKFFAIPILVSLPEALTKRTAAIRRGEMQAYLQVIHPYVLHVVSQAYYEHGLTATPLIKTQIDTLGSIMEKIPNLPDLFNKVEADRRTTLESFLTRLSIYSRIRLNNSDSNLENNLALSNADFLFNDFPGEFLDRLTTDIYPPWYSASFLSVCKNSAIWGHYGDNHRGVCLIFKSTLNKYEAPGLSLTREYGFNEKPLVGDVHHQFIKMRYENEPVSIDFFRSIGRLRAFELDRLWYKDDKDNRSSYGSHLVEGEEQWREKYWNNFYDSFSIKLKEWEYENEMRLVLHGDLKDYNEKGSRKLQYNFRDLTGIIFGIRTAESDKAEIIRVIKEKCKESQRETFDFYQAYYSISTKQVDTFKLPILN